MGYDSVANLNRFIDVAERLESAYAGHCVVGIGESTSRLIAALGAIRAREESSVRVENVAFTNQFVECENINRGVFRADEDEYPGEDVVDAYHEYLSEKKMDAPGMLRAFRINAKPVVVCDVAMGGNGLVSFMHLLRRNFEKKTTCSTPLRTW